MVELAISVALFAVLLLAATAGLQSILTTNQVNQQVQTVARLGGKVSALYASGTSGVTQTELIQVGGWASESANASTGYITSAFGTPETIAPNANTAGDMSPNTGFVLNIHHVPKAACADLGRGLSTLVYAMAIWGGNSDASSNQNNNTHTEPPTGNGGWADAAQTQLPGKPLNPLSLSSQCSQTGQDLYTFIVFLKP